MCDCLPYNYKSAQHLEDGSFPLFCQYSSLLNERYRILKPLGQGSFGKTFLAVDEKQENTHPTPKLCVIKQFFSHRHQFEQKSLLLAVVGQHPHIPELLDTFEQDGQHYLVQEWFDGQTLAQELSLAGAFNEAEIRHLLGKLLPILQFVHDHQVIHCDIKPANIIRRPSFNSLCGGDIILIDFGAAKYITSGMEATRTLIGSAEYAAPEQIRGKPVFASDLYSLGVTCLQLLTQMPPFDLLDCSEDAWIWRSYLSSPISSSLEQILHKLLQRSTKQRYQSAKEVLFDLNTSSQHVVFPSQPTASWSADDDFETPYFGFSLSENLQYASNISYAAKLDLHSIAAVTIFDPQTQAWYYLPPKRESLDMTQKVTAFLEPHPVTKGTMQKLGKITWQIFTAVAATYIVCCCVAFFASGVQSSPTAHSLKLENWRIFDQLLRMRKE